MLDHAFGFARPMLSAIAAIGLLSVGCTSSAPTTSGMATHQVDDSTRRHMRTMADELLQLTAITADRAADGDSAQDTRLLTLGSLDRIEREARATSPRFMTDLLEDIAVARTFVKRDPPNLIPANRLVQSCLACHRSLQQGIP